MERDGARWSEMERDGARWPNATASHVSRLGVAHLVDQHRVALVGRSHAAQLAARRAKDWGWGVNLGELYNEGDGGRRWKLAAAYLERLHTSRGRQEQYEVIGSVGKC